MKPARMAYLTEKERFQLHTLRSPNITTTKLPEIGVQGAAAYFLSCRGG